MFMLSARVRCFIGQCWVSSQFLQGVDVYVCIYSHECEAGKLRSLRFAGCCWSALLKRAVYKYAPHLNLCALRFLLATTTFPATSTLFNPLPEVAYNKIEKPVLHA